MQAEARTQFNSSQSAIESTATRGIYRNYIKRPMDIVLSLAAIVVLSPVMLLTAFLVRIKLGSPVIFKQKRPGLNEKIFTLYKFRTMTDTRDARGNLLPDEKRLTEFGKFLRSTSLDELPELFNILKGDMSVVGPRPLLVQYLPLYNAYQRRRHEVRPGLSGLAQVSGRNAITWDEKFVLDVKYVDNVSLLGDWKIIFQTLSNALTRDGINQEGQATIQLFKGPKKQLVVIGAGGHGKVIADIALKMDKWEQILFLDDNSSLKSNMGFDVVGKISDVERYLGSSNVFVAVGDNRTRADLHRRLENKEANIPVLIHPAAIIGEGVEIGEGTVVMAGAIINSGTRIGKGCIINTGATIDHDNVLEDYVHVSPGVHTAGNVVIREHSWIGIGASISNNVTITGESIIGAGAVVINDIWKKGTYIGIPAREMTNESYNTN